MYSFNVKTDLFQTIQFSINTVIMSKTALFQPIQFSISGQFNSMWSIDRTLSGITTPGQSGPRSNSNEGVLRISRSSSISGTSASDCLVSYQGHSVEKPSVYCTTPADWAKSKKNWPKRHSIDNAATRKNEKLYIYIYIYI